jgi:hypothetical protein
VRHLTIHHLSPERVGQAFALIQAVMPGVGLEDWQKFATPLVDPRARTRGGILTVVSEQAYIAGLSIYRVEPDLEHGPALVADHFTALDLFDRQAVVHALAGALEDLARERGCTAIHTNVRERTALKREDDNSLVSALCSRGHHIESLRLCKVLSQPHQPQSTGKGVGVRTTGGRRRGPTCTSVGMA